MSGFRVKRSYRQLQVEKIAMELLIATVKIERCTIFREKERVEKLKSRQQSNKAFLTEIERDIEIAKEKMGK